MISHYYSAILFRGETGQAISLDEPGWMATAKDLTAFTLAPLLPGLHNHTVVLNDCELVYFSRVFGTSRTGPLFRLYCVGRLKNGIAHTIWIYPTGDSVNAADPILIDELMANALEDEDG
jgi:hypothetical protein